jgi:hypothetical protein
MRGKRVSAIQRGGETSPRDKERAIKELRN